MKYFLSCFRKTLKTNKPLKLSKKKIIMSSSVSSNTIANCNPETGVSLCIPRVFNNIGWRRIKQTMISCGWGYVDRVDVIPCGTHKRAFVHFAPGKWNTRSGEAMAVLEAFRNGQQVQVVYDEPWFWKISASGSKKPAEGPKPKQRPTVRISDALPSVLTNPPDVDQISVETIQQEVAQEIAGSHSPPRYDNLNSFPEDDGEEKVEA